MEHKLLKTEQTEEYLNSAKEQRRQELESQFTYDGFQVVRKELFAHFRDPAVTIRDGSITFNAACIRGLEDAVYVKLMINERLGRMTVQRCHENDVNALRWCVTRHGKRKSRRMSCRLFTDLVYKVMGWEKQCRYKMLGYRIEYDDDVLFVFDLHVPEIFHERPTKQIEARQEKNTTSSTEAEPTSNTRSSYYPQEIASTFGVSVEEYKKQTDIKEMDGYISMAMLTGARSFVGSKENNPSFLPAIIGEQGSSMPISTT